MFDKVKESSVQFMQAHPTFTKRFVAGTTALATFGSGAIVASADDPEQTTAASADVVDTIVSKMGTELSGVAEKVIPAAVGVGIVFVAASLAWRWFKRMAYN